MTGASTADAHREELVAQLSSAALGAMDLFCVYLGDRLGLYRALADNGALTSDQLAAAAAVSERYAREWLEQQAMSGILTSTALSLMTGSVAMCFRRGTTRCC